MKNLKLMLGILTVAVSVTSCKNDDQKQAEKSVEKYQMYVDSISKVAQKDAMENWENIEAKYVEAKAEAELAIEKAENKEELSIKVNDYSTKYDEFKTTVVAEKSKMDAAAGTSKIRMSLLGSSAVGNDMQFEWVNKDNILGVYDNFVNTVQKNKDTYSREDWDEIKLLYEALDTRKNTVEKEGLTGEDNRKIAGLKLKFGPMYTVNRMGAKSEENSEAKK
jgi:hypothetical protein